MTAPTGKTSVRKAARAGAVKGGTAAVELGPAGTFTGAAVGAARGARTARKNNKRVARSNSGAMTAKGTVKSLTSGGKRVIVAEFLICIVILALSPLTSKHSGDTPVAWMKRGVSICLLFFILALVSSGGPRASRVAAGFGGVVTLALLMSSREIFTVLAARFNGGPGTTGGGDLGPDGAPINADVTPPPPGTLPDGSSTGTGTGGLGPGGVPL